ncbi:MAG: phospho-N-acetylmuramoyl-pentapeptide-transferase [Bacilli bacterium]
MSSLFILISLALVCFIVNVVIIKAFIPILKRLKFGQSIRTEGPKNHLVKNGTPTLGGIFIILNTILFYIVARIILKDEFSTTSIINEILIFIPFIGYGIIGLIDDLLTIKKKQNEGLTPRKKFILELIIATIFYLLYLTVSFDNSLNFFGIKVELYFIYGVILLFLFTGFTNATNFTDGIDGLLGTTSLTSFICIGIYSYLVNQYLIAIICLIISMVILGFLLFNFNRAKLFMGDTGSLAIGGLIVSMLIYLKSEILILFFGLIYIVEIISVILQVWFFKKTKGDRLFKMTPLHHHYELQGYSEYSIDLYFSLINLLFSLIGIMIGVNVL